MDKMKPDEALSGRSIAKRIVAKMKLQGQRKVVNIKNVIAGHAMTEGLQKTVVSGKSLRVSIRLAPRTSTPRTRCQSCRNSLWS